MTDDATAATRVVAGVPHPGSLRTSTAPDRDAQRSALAIAAAIRAGTTTAVAAVERTLDAIARVDPQLNSFSAVTRARALDEARAVDARRAAGEALSPLAGVPYAVKNLFDVAGIATLAGSRVNADLPPAREDAMLVARMRDAGAVLVGALHMDEYAYGFTTENSHYGPTRNPHDPTRIAGGSSGGSAAAVAARLVPLSPGSDTNGSIRVPSSLCGVWGLKTTFGRLPRTGSFPFVASLDHLGPFTARYPTSPPATTHCRAAIRATPHVHCDCRSQSARRFHRRRATCALPVLAATSTST